MKTLIIASGGDAPGINTAAYSLAKFASQTGNSLIGVQAAFSGLLDRNFVNPLSATLLAPHVSQGGTFLATSRTLELHNEHNRQSVVRILKENDVDNVILFGGDGTLRNIPPILEQLNISCIGIPATIDNDVPGTEKTIGFDSACTYAYSAIDGLLATARALCGRIFSVEVLGGHTGFIALDVAYAANAHAVLIPEFEIDIEHVISQLLKGAETDGWGLLILSEGIADKANVLHTIQDGIGQKLRTTQLGHGQRGSTPTHADRIVAKKMSRAAYDALLDGEKFGTCIIQGGEVSFVPAFVNAFPARLPDETMFRQINRLEETALNG